ncbi:K Homology domain, type 1 [Dillenia turbinata]|uniref:K Homology domain, type 1 n=1 Tax=Dillenia turbinata TaxID=194707 RepID=A0AAN8ZHJ7_9MAGN
MSLSLTPSKRPHDGGMTEANGRGKWPKSAGSHSLNQQVKLSPGSTLFRVLCPASKIGSVIGKGGTTISQIRRETGAKVRVEDTIPGCDERVIVLIGSDKEIETCNDKSKNDNESTMVSEDGDKPKENGENTEDRGSVPKEEVPSEKGTSSVQKALLLVFDRIVEGEGEEDEEAEDSSKSSSKILRLLVLPNQVGCLLGKAGSVIKQMSAESGAQIRILPKDKLPLCASPSDELVQISGMLDAVRKALQSISQQILENPLRDHDSSFSTPTGSFSQSIGEAFPRNEVFPPPNYPVPVQGRHMVAGPHDGTDYHPIGHALVPKFYDSFVPGRLKASHEILAFRLLCEAERVGSVIGKGGVIVKSLENETGCEINVLDGPSDSDDRVIVVSGPAHPDDRISAVQDAVLRVHARIVRAIPDGKDKTVIARLIVSSNQIGCLLGKGGAIITEMRKSTGAYIRIAGKDQTPRIASENEELVQMNGEFEAVQEALLQITTRLRNHFFRDAFPSINNAANPAFSDQGPPFPSYMGRRELSPPGMHSNLAPSFHKFDAVSGLPPRGSFHPHDDRPTFGHDIHRLAVPRYISERPPSALWGPQGSAEGGGLIGLSEYTGIPQRRPAGFGGGQPAIITNTTVEVVVPRSVVPVLQGEDGRCLIEVRKPGSGNQVRGRLWWNAISQEVAKLPNAASFCSFLSSWTMNNFCTRWLLLTKLAFVPWGYNPVFASPRYALVVKL